MKFFANNLRFDEQFIQLEIESVISVAGYDNAGFRIVDMRIDIGSMGYSFRCLVY